MTEKTNASPNRRRPRSRQKPRFLIISIKNYNPLPAAIFFSRYGFLVEVQQAAAFRFALHPRYSFALIVGGSEANRKRIGARLQRERPWQEYLMLSGGHLGEFVGIRHERRYKRRPHKLIEKLIGFKGKGAEQGNLVAHPEPALRRRIGEMASVLRDVPAPAAPLPPPPSVFFKYPLVWGEHTMPSVRRSEWLWRTGYLLIYLAAFAISYTKGILSFDLLAVAVLFCCMLSLQRWERDW